MYNISAYTGTSGILFFFKIKMRISLLSKKNHHYLCKDGIEKSVPPDHHLSSFCKSRDAKRSSSGGIFLSHPQTNDGFFCLSLKLHIINIQSYLIL